MTFFRRYFIWLVLVAVLLGSAFTVYRQQEQKLAEMRSELADRQQHLEDLRAAIRLLEHEVDALDTAASKEALAREKLNMIRPDEMIYIITFDQ